VSAPPRVLRGAPAFTLLKFMSIDGRTDLRASKQEPRTGEVYYHLAQRLGRAQGGRHVTGYSVAIHDGTSGDDGRLPPLAH
jgi:hypothetical protein